MSSVAQAEPQRCAALKKDGSLCQAKAVGGTDYCIGHQPDSQAARSRGGTATRKSEKALRLLPARLRPIADIIARAIEDVRDGELTPQQGQAMASLAGALTRVIQAGELEERMRSIESRLKEERAA